MALLNLKRISISFSGPALLDGIDFAVEAGEKICLIGRNGAGKSTLLKVINGLIPTDDGEMHYEQGTRIAYLPQEVPRDITGTIFDVVASGLEGTGELLTRYEHLTHELETDFSDKLLEELEVVQHKIEQSDGWNLHQQVKTILSTLQLDESQEFSALSGGLKRRVLLAKSLVTDPDILLLDEPTNHLDIESIDWLEGFLKQDNRALIFISHDRMFLDKVATRIVELDRGNLSSWPGNYQNYLVKKAEALAVEDQQNSLFDKRLAEEEKWIRQGVKARRTRNEGRVRELEAMREEHKQRRNRQGNVSLTSNTGNASGKIVLEAKHLSYAYEDKAIIKDFSTQILRGDRIGIIGPNGVGKTTLINLLLSKIEPDAGSVHHGTKLQVAYFDQLRGQLNENKSVIDNVGEGSDTIEINGNQKHIISYLQDFLFTPERARTPVRALSGGERNRLLLAKLFTRPSNLLVMDEPTNDLDSETLELLEECLSLYKGTLLLISHDRTFLNNVVSSTLVYEGHATVNQYIGGYDDWLRQRDEPSSKSSSTQKDYSNTETTSKAKTANKLSYKDQRELESLPGIVETLEAGIETLQQTMAAPDFFKQEQSSIKGITQDLEEQQKTLESAYSRWEILDQ